MIAQAGPLDGVTAQATSQRDELLLFIAQTGLPLVMSLALTGVGIALGARYIRRAVEQYRGGTLGD